MKKPRQNTKAFCVEFVFLILLVIEPDSVLKTFLIMNDLVKFKFQLNIPLKCRLNFP